MFPAAFLTRYPHAWKPGFDHDLADLVNVAVDLYPFTKPLRFAPNTPALDPLPVRDTGMFHRVATQGHSTTAFRFGYLPLAAFQYTLTTYFTSDGDDLPEAEMTVYTRDVERARYGRFNAIVYRPVPSRDYQFEGSVVTAVSYPMLLLEYLPEPEPEPEP